MSPLAINILTRIGSLAGMSSMRTSPDIEMVEGYRDGFDLDSPEPSANRSHSYRHGFKNGRDDRDATPRAEAAVLRKEADEARTKDADA